MVTRTAQQLLDDAVPQVAPGMPLPQLAAALMAAHVDGACVVEHGKLLGVVTSMDLIFQDKPVHLPTLLTIMDAVIPLESPRRTVAELQKMAGATVAEVMTRKVHSVGPAATLSEVARLMVEKHLTIIPVVTPDGKLLGAVSKAAMLRSQLDA